MKSPSKPPKARKQKAFKIGDRVKAVAEFVCMEGEIWSIDSENRRSFSGKTGTITETKRSPYDGTPGWHVDFDGDKYGWDIPTRYLARVSIRVVRRNPHLKEKK